MLSYPLLGVGFPAGYSGVGVNGAGQLNLCGVMGITSGDIRRVHGHYW